MKKALCIAVAIMAFPGAALAQLPPVGYIGLYIDTSPPPSTCCVTGENFYPVEMYIWCLPSEHGMICSEFRVEYPVNIIQSTVTTNTNIIIIPPHGDLATGVSVCYIECMWDWHWNFHQTLYVTDSMPTCANIAKHPDPLITCVHFANCLPEYPTECVTVHSRLCFNQECPPEHCIGTKEASWGAVKSLFRE
ncbi:MAG: hypothetical protein JSV33_10680 [bacterium]|nr:MAG: hypothetical protein JSV33_10680 [bacterium]